MHQMSHLSRLRMLIGALALLASCAALSVAQPLASFAEEPPAAPASQAAVQGGAKLSLQGLESVALQEGSAKDENDVFGPDDGSGTEGDPYRIREVQQLLRFAESVDNGTNYEGKFICVDAELDVSGYWSSGHVDWNPIGAEAAVSEQGETKTKGTSFAGTFDGKLKPIKGLRLGSEGESASVANDYNYIGLFAALAPTATVKNVVLKDVSFDVESTGDLYVGGIAAYMDAEAGASSGPAQGAVIDYCSVEGALQAHIDSAEGDEGSVCMGGIAARQIGGAIVNCESNVSVQGASAGRPCEVGGLVGMSNRGLVANSYALRNVGGSARYSGGGGAPFVSALVGLLGSEMANCYARGSIEASESAEFAGAAFGQLAGNGKAFNCYYDAKVKLVAAGVEKPVPGTGSYDSPRLFKNIIGLDDFDEGEGSAAHQRLAALLNGTFSRFPIDVSPYGLRDKPFFPWGVSGEANSTITEVDGIATLLVEVPRAVTFVPPNVDVNDKLRDGIWYGRSMDGSYQVEIEVKSGSTLVRKEGNSELLEEARDRAEEKSAHGDVSGYGKPRPGLFAGGSGTQDDPYLVSSEDELRAIAESVNEDNDWSGVYFRQVGDIAISSGEPWLPIGWGIASEAGSYPDHYCSYPFAGTYDGAGCSITGLEVNGGQDDEPSSDQASWCRSYGGGLFGVVRGATIANVNLVDAKVDVKSAYDSSVGLLVGRAEAGFLVQNCSVSGSVSLESAARESAVTAGKMRAGGLIGYASQGSVIDSEADVAVSVQSAASDAYGGGLIGVDDNVMSVACSAEGDVVGDSGKEASAHVGGLTGQSSGILYNCVARGNVTSAVKTADAGLLSGTLVGSALERRCYFEADARLSVGGEPVSPATANGSVATGVLDGENQAEGRAADYLGSDDFAELRARNDADLPDELRTIADLLGVSIEGSAIRYFSGSDLSAAVVTLASAPPVFNGMPQTPTVAVSLSGRALKEGDDFSVQAYRDNLNAGIARVVVVGKGLYHGRQTGYFRIGKAPNDFSVKLVKKTQKAKAGKTTKIKAKKVFKVTRNASGGAVTYKIAKLPKKAKKKIKVSSSGKVTVKKGLKRGTYKVKVMVASAETPNYLPASKSLTLKIKVR